MATDKLGGVAAYPGSGSGSDRVMVVTQRIKFADIAEADRGIDDLIEAIPVRANTAVMAAGIFVVTPSEGAGAATLGLGDGGGDTKYVGGLSAKAAGQESSYDNDTSGNGGVYAAADTIDVKIEVAAVDDKLVIDVWAVIVDLNYRETSASIEDKQSLPFPGND